jgi:AcrR family transcriptional regulator
MQHQRKPGRPSKREAESLNETMLEIAYASFCDLGFAAASIEGIAARCGVAKNAIYRRFSDKQALFRATIQHKIGAFDLMLEGIADFTRPPLENVRIAAREIARLTHEPQTLNMIRLLISEQARFPDLVLQLDHWYDVFYRRLDELLMVAMTHGHFATRPVRPLRDTLVMLIGTPSLDQLILADRVAVMPDNVFDDRWNLFLNGAQQRQ